MFFLNSPSFFIGFRINLGVIGRLKNFFSRYKIKKYPSKKQWRQIFKVFNRKEKIAFFVFLVLFLGSLVTLLCNFYLKSTEVQASQGGVYIEGVIGQPRFVNPIYSRVSDVDQDLVELIFSGLMKYDSTGQIVPDLAKSYEIKDGGRTYEVYLKENVLWSDGQPLTTDDVIFTIKTIQNSEYKSPVIASWLGVEVKKISDTGLKFELKNPYGSFLENLTQKIIPEHIWKDISPQNFPLTVNNLKPIGSGPYELKDIKQDDQGKIIFLNLARNPKYFGKKPYISQINFRFFDKEESLRNSYKNGEIKGFSLVLPTNSLNLDSSAQTHSFSLPRYFAVFLNPDRAKILDDLNIRQALNYATNKDEIIKRALSGYGQAVNSPILPEIYGFNTPSENYQFNLDNAKNLIKKAGFVEKDGKLVKIINKEPAFQFKSDLKEGFSGTEVEALQRCLAKDPEVYPEAEISGSFGKLTRAAVIKFQEKYAKDILEPAGLKEGTGVVSKATRNKLNQLCFPSLDENLPLKFSLTTVNQPALINVANILKEQWSKSGIEVEIKTYDISQVEKDIIKQRSYDSLLFGEVLASVPDPFPFWHSTQIKDPGLNLAFYQNKDADKLLQEARQSQDSLERKKKLEEFQDILIKDAPVVFLYNPDYLHLVSSEIKGIEGKIITDPSKRFSGIVNWYIDTKRVWK